jgi:hypothetical protein
MNYVFSSYKTFKFSQILFISRPNSGLIWPRFPRKWKVNTKKELYYYILPKKKPLLYKNKISDKNQVGKSYIFHILLL